MDDEIKERKTKTEIDDNSKNSDKENKVKRPIIHFKSFGHKKKRRNSKSGIEGKEQSELFTSTYHFKPPPDDKMIALKVRPQMFAILSFAFPLAVGVVCFFLYTMEGRYSGYWATISETGTEYPNKTFFAQMMSTGSMTTLLSLYIYSCYIKMTYKPSKIFMKFIGIFMVLEVVGVAGLGFSPINEVHTQHLCFASTGFVAILMFELLCFIKEDKNSSRSLVRGVSLFLAFAGLFVFGLADLFFDKRINVTISTIGEWVLLFFMLFVILSWGNDMNKVKIYVAILDE